MCLLEKKHSVTTIGIKQTIFQPVTKAGIKYGYIIRMESKK